MRKWAIIASIWLVAATTLAFAAVAFGNERHGDGDRVSRGNQAHRVCVHRGDEHHGDGDHVSSGSSEYHHHGDDGGHHDRGGDD